jgi:type IV/VI secretion system ImpK/VasF family protein
MRLIDYFIETFIYIEYFLKSDLKNDLTFQQARDKLLTDLLPSPSKCPLHGYSEALFAVCAWIDERIKNCSAWRDSVIWNGKPIVEEQSFVNYGPVQAGVEFFKKLDNLLSNNTPSSIIDALEVYYLCLNLDFKGVYFTDKNAGTLASYKERVYNRLQSAHQFSLDAPLFPDACQKQVIETPKPKPSYASLLVPVSTVVACAIIVMLWFAFGSRLDATQDVLMRKSQLEINVD